MSSVWNNRISVSIFGESHGPAIGVVIDNLPAGENVDVAELMKFLARRAPKKDGTTTNRNESDFPQIMSGVVNNKTTGTPLCAFIQNTDQHSGDYSNISKLARPGHADYTGALRYRGFNDVRGGGHFSGRLTAPLVFAGAVCGQILERRGIYTGAHILSIHNVKDTAFNPISVSREEIIKLRNKKFPVINDKKGEAMIEDINKARESLDSLGGVVECISVNVPAGIGSPIFDGLENNIAQLIFGIPAVKGIEFGAGFNCAKLTGSQNNDEFYLDERGHVLTKTNNHGGILGGISSGMPITCRVAFKPTPSIARPQETVDYSAMKNEVINIKGRHDPCVVARAVPCVEAAVNIALLSNMLDYPNFEFIEESLMYDISKVSADCSFQLTDSLSVRILICYLLKKLDRPVTADQLYEIAVGNEIINYFYYTEAVTELIKNKTILTEKNENGEIYILTEKGMYGAEEFKKYVPKTFREKLLSAALKYFAKLKMESEVKCQLIESKNGYYVKCEILDSDYNLMELKLFAPDEEQAKLVMDRILLNPTDFYGKVIGFALENKEYEPVIED